MIGPPQSSVEEILDSLAERVASRVARRLPAAPPRKRLLTVAEAAEYLGRTKASVHHLIASEAFRVVRADRRVHLDILDLDAWIGQNKNGV